MRSQGANFMASCSVCRSSTTSCTSKYVVATLDVLSVVRQCSLSKISLTIVVLCNSRLFGKCKLEGSIKKCVCVYSMCIPLLFNLSHDSSKRFFRREHSISLYRYHIPVKFGIFSHFGFFREHKTHTKYAINNKPMCYTITLISVYILPLTSKKYPTYHFNDLINTFDQRSPRNSVWLMCESSYKTTQFYTLKHVDLIV